MQVDALPGRWAAGNAVRTAEHFEYADGCHWYHLAECDLNLGQEKAEPGAAVIDCTTATDTRVPRPVASVVTCVEVKFVVTPPSVNDSAVKPGLPPMV